MLGGARYPSPEISTRADADRLVALPLGGNGLPALEPQSETGPARGDISILIDRYNVNYRFNRKMLIYARPLGNSRSRAASRASSGLSMLRPTSAGRPAEGGCYTWVADPAIAYLPLPRRARGRQTGKPEAGDLKGRPYNVAGAGLLP